MTHDGLKVKVFSEYAYFRINLTELKHNRKIVESKLSTEMLSPGQMFTHRKHRSCGCKDVRLTIPYWFLVECELYSLLYMLQRCKDVPTSHDAASWSPQKSTSPLNALSSISPLSATPTCSVPLHRVVYVHTPFQPPTSIASDPSASTHPFQQPFIAVSTPSLLPAAPQGPGAPGARPKTDAIQLLRNLTTVSSLATVPTPIRPCPVPPQLVRGGAPPPSPLPSKLPLPPLRMRPPPRLTAAPGILVSTGQLTPTSVAIIASSPSSRPALAVASGSQPQPQMMTLPSALLSHLNLSQPLAVKLNNAQVVVPPSCIISSKDGLKVVMKWQQ